MKEPDPSGIAKRRRAAEADIVGFKPKPCRTCGTCPTCGKVTARPYAQPYWYGAYGSPPNVHYGTSVG